MNRKEGKFDTHEKTMFWSSKPNCSIYTLHITYNISAVTSLVFLPTCHL